jgi:hypothetical protein
VGFVEKDLALQVTLRDISITDYFSSANAANIACAYAIESLKLVPGTFDINAPDMRSSVASNFDNNIFAFGGGDNNGRVSAASRDVDYFGSGSKNR